MSIKVNKNYIGEFDAARYGEFCALAKNALERIEKKDGAGAEFLGWTALPDVVSGDEYRRLKKTAARIAESSDVLVVVGIGGSYLGARSAIEFIKGQNCNLIADGAPQVIFAGNSLSPSSMNDVLRIIGNRRVFVNVISKSGTTTEPAAAFAILKDYMEKRYGEKARERIVATTDRSRGALKALADSKGYETFAVPDDVGGRYSVLSPVGLLPIAAAGIDVDAMLGGAAAARERYLEKKTDFAPLEYAALRNMLFCAGKAIEIFASFEPALFSTGEWWKQLYGESEGKNHKGIFPAAVCYSTDLHSLGQYVQDGVRDIFETVVCVDDSEDAELPYSEEENGVNYLCGKGFSFINKAARDATLAAHLSGGCPAILLEAGARTPETYGELVFFFELACAASGYIGGVNPFDQPGVEEYKKNMYRLLGKPGYQV